MSNRLNEILDEIRELEKSVQKEMIRKEEELKYTVKKGKVVFEKEIAELHKKFAGSLFLYVIRSSLLTALSGPVIYAMIIPALIFDASISLYQMVCFPVYKILKVKRKDHIILDRHYLKYLNFIERLSCDYCSYFNGLLSYSTEVAARTEQYWCPIKHASGKGKRHSRYHKFVDYGDAETYRARLAEIRKQYNDVD